MAEKSLDDQLKEAELAIKEAELAKIKSEDEKVKAETDLVRKQINEKWYYDAGKIIAVALTILALYAAIDQFFLVEVKQKKKILAEVDAQILEAKTKLLEIRRDSLNREIDPIRIRSTLSHAFGDLPDSLYDNALKQYWMIIRNGYFDDHLNPKGKGIENKFETQNRDNVIYDAERGLTWQAKVSFEKKKWKDVQAYIDSLNTTKYADYNDWRLPRLEEAMSLMKPKELTYSVSWDDSLYVDPLFEDTPAIWTSDKLSASRIWYVKFNNGYCSNVEIDLNFYVRAVR